MLKTAMTDILGIEHPIQCGTMQWISRPSLVAAVAQAGGLACLASTIFGDPAGLTQAIQETRELTNKPFGVNVSLFPSLNATPPGEMIQAAIDSGVKIIETSGRSPEPFRLMIKEAGMVHIHKCARVRDAVKADTLGVDMVSVVGLECGGHPSMEKVTSLVLIPRAVDAVKIPLIAGGGFGDARGLVAALALGAAGVNMGTRFMATQECPISPEIKKRMIEAHEAETVLVMESLNNPSRVLKTPWTEKVLEMESQGAALQDLAPMISGQLSREGWTSGSLEKGIYPMGQLVGRIEDIPTVRDLIERTIHGAMEIREGLSKL